MEQNLKKVKYSNDTDDEDEIDEMIRQMQMQMHKDDVVYDDVVYDDEVYDDDDVDYDDGDYDVDDDDVDGYVDYDDIKHIVDVNDHQQHDYSEDITDYEQYMTISKNLTGMNNNNCICTDPNCSGCEALLQREEDRESKYILDYWKKGPNYPAGYYLGEIEGEDIYYYPFLIDENTYEILGVYDGASGNVVEGLYLLTNFIPISNSIAEDILESPFK